ncbi:MAG TPA: hypothetical protein VEL76_17320 [Gemmataceae bacterium]|nr:hypothetical protein [Gemmataceae bacterium]
MTTTSSRLCALAYLALAVLPTASAAGGDETLPAGALLRLRTAAGADAPKYPDHPACVAFVAFTSDGKAIISANRHEGVRHWDAATGKELARWRDRGAELWAAAMAPDGRKVVWGPGWNRRLYIWDPAGAKKPSELAVSEDKGKALAFSPDGKLLAGGKSRYEDGVVSVWDWPAGTKRHQLRLKLGDVMALAFSPDGSILACGAIGGVRLWDVKTGRELRTLPARSACALAFSPDSKLLVTPHGNESGPMTIWDVATGKAVRQLTPLVTDGRYGWTAAVVFSADGRTLASVGGDRCLRVWDVAAGKERCIFRGHTGPAMSVAFAPDGKRLVTGGGDCTILVWDTWGLSMPSATALADGGSAALWRALAREEGEPAKQARKRPNKEGIPVLREDLRQAHHAIGLLVASPEKAVPWLREWLKPAAPERLRQLFTDLDNRQFAVRDKATQELEHFGQDGLPALRKHLQTSLPLEVKRRIEQIIERLEKAPPFSQGRATLRAIEALEYIGTVEARQLLESLVQSAPDERHRLEARASLQRLRNRPAPSPPRTAGIAP